MKRIITVLVPLLALLALVGWRMSQKRAEARKQSEQRQTKGKTPLTVDVAEAKRRDIIRTYEAVGSIEAPTSVQIAPRISGRVTFLQVREGDRVTPGQVLARVDTTEIDSLIAQKQAALAQARDRLAQAQATQGANAVGVQNAVSTQNAALQTARARAAQVSADQNARVAAATAAVVQAKGRVSAADAQIKSAEATIQTAQASLDNAQTDLNRQESLLKEGATAQQVVDNARTLVQVRQGGVGEAVQARAQAVAARQSALADQNAATQQVVIVRQQARADQAAAVAAVAQASAAVQTAVANRAQTPAYQKNLDALQGAVEAAQADIQTTLAQKSYAELRSPISGVVTARNADPGALATVGTPLLSVGTVASAFAVVAVPEEVATGLKTGQSARVRPDSDSNVSATGRIERVFPSADPQSRQFTVRVLLTNAANRFRPGGFARVVFVTQKVAGALVVPREAVKVQPPKGGESASGDGQSKTGGKAPSDTNKETGSFVAVVQNGTTAALRPVKTGASDDKYVQILSGLQENDSVIILAGRDVKDGQNVRIAGQNQKGAGSKGTETNVAAPNTTGNQTGPHAAR